MSYKLIEWHSSNQLNADLTLTPLTKMRFGFNQMDHIILTDAKTYDKLFDVETNLKIKGLNTPIDNVTPANKYKLSVLKNKNLTNSKLYLEVLKYSDFFIGYSIGDDLIEKSNITDVTHSEDYGYTVQFEDFFSALDTNTKFTDSDYESFIVGWSSILD
jgi:hypothetical protein